MNRPVSYFLIAAIAVLAAVLTLGAGFLTEIMWYKSTGFLNVFWTIFYSRWVVRIASGVLFFFFIYINLLTAGGKLSRALSYKYREGVVNDALSAVLTGRWVKRFLLAASFILAAIFTAFTSSYWLTVQKFLHPSSFGISDPLFKKDIGFYVFKLPFYQEAYELAITTVVMTMVAVAALFLMAHIEEGPGSWLDLLAREKQVVFLMALFFVLKAYGYRLSMYNLLYSPRGVAFGASYTDVHAVLPALKIMMALSLVLAALLVVNLAVKRPAMLVWTLGVFIAASIVLQGVYPNLVQKLQVTPNEFVKEEPFLKTNIEFTLKAYGLDRVERKVYPVKETVNPEVIFNSPTLKTLRLWDYRPLQQTYNQLQRIRPYYNFAQVDVDRYTINGEIRQVMLAARELDQGRLPEERANTWINRRLQYTHGYGLVMSPVNSVSAEGLPNYFIKDIPPVSGDPSLKIREPRIYFGELTREYVVVNSRTPEFDYPSGETNAYTEYSGTGGIPINFWSRLLFAIRFGDYKLLVSTNFDSDSRILFDRDIKTMVKKVAPFIRFDIDPYLVVASGRLYWIIDGYTVTDRYPYSEPVEGINYIRNSVKAVIDAYNGTMDFYMADKSDPIIKSYAAIFPGVFKPMERMPKEIKAHIRYPEDLFLIQARVYTLYHMEDTKVFYNKEDVWQIPDEIYGSERQKMEPYYTILQLPGENKPEMVLMLPFTPATIENMRAWMAARCDGENYGKIVLYLFPKDKTVYGPMQIEARINQDSQISQQLTLWDQRGSRVIRGNLLVLPVDGSIIYVRPVFIQGEQSQLPELSRVVVAYGEHVVMERTFEAAVARIFGEPAAERAAPVVPAGEMTADEMIKRAATLYDEAVKAQREGDWATYGQKINELGVLLKKLSGKP
ncbi:UPF0182 family protein [Thermoanaerobacterium sp. DL9XJH110]|uniref:UPF0182 family membrane protein n=1 Tax=Thermoanaerobacterium sp. DL9XJH110 TaxID=3386643 RepID=UPI003BB774C2